jgi:hypothetical protein
VPLTNQQLYFNGSPSTIGSYRVPKTLPKPKNRSLSPAQAYFNGVNPQSQVRLSTVTPRARAAPAASSAPRPSSGASGAVAASGAGVSSVLAALGQLGMAGALSNADKVRLKQQASSDVGLELNPEISARQFAFNEAARQAHAQADALRKQLGLRTSETKQLYGALDVMLQSIAAKQQGLMDTARSKTDAAYGTLGQQIDQRYTQATAATQAELARLGQNASPATGRLSADKANAAATVGTQKANADSTIAAIQAAAAGEQGQLRASAAATAPMLITQAKTQTDQSIADLNRQRADAQRQLQFEIKQLSGSRKAKVQKLYQQYLAEAQQAAQDQAQMQFLNGVKAAELGISQAQLQLAQQKAGNDAQVSQANLVLRAKELQAKLQGGTKVPQTGMEKAYTYLQGYKGRVPQSQLQAVLEDAINGNSNDRGFNPGAPAGTPGQIPGYNKSFLDVYLRDVTKAAASRGWSSAEANALRNAVLKYLGA